MENLLVLSGRVAGVLGILVCAVAAIWRLLGHFSLAGFWVGTVLQAGVSAVVIGCFLLLLAMADRP